MGCIYECTWPGKDEPTCTMWDKSIEMPGCDSKGDCRCSYDPDPSRLCDTYESDNTCSECDCDLNVVEECDCEED